MNYQQHTIKNIEPAILELMVSGAISVMKPKGMYAGCMVFYGNAREAVLFDFETQRTFPVDRTVK